MHNLITKYVFKFRPFVVFYFYFFRTFCAIILGVLIRVFCEFRLGIPTIP